ncbi:hypothetical protein M885DRAFT_506681 [Pelagophyceae sp. CCMP2097]|nr:hypothetical protein M885DRAFT_506681 [Pelagophyceae sp. CCMP2097]
MEDLEVEFQSWLRDGGEVHPALDLLGGAGERGVYARSSIARGEVLLRVPSSKCVFAADAAAGGASQLRLASALADLLQEPRNSAFGPYLESLPLRPPALEVWTAAERRLLRGTSLRSHAAQKPEPTTPWLHAARLVQTRALELDVGHIQGWCLAPGIDALNDYRGRCEQPSTRLRVDEVGEGFELVMYAERKIAAGDEVAHCYDDAATAAQLLERYGFFAPGGLPAAADFEVDDVIHGCADHLEPRRRACRSATAPHSRVSVTLDGPLPEPLLSVFILMLMPASDFLELQADDAANLDAVEILLDDADFAAIVLGAVDEAALSKIQAFADEDDFLAAGLDSARSDAAFSLRGAERETLQGLRRAAKQLLGKAQLRAAKSRR